MGSGWKVSLGAIVCVIASVISITTCVPVKADYETVQLTLLAEYWNTDHRVRRAAGSILADNLSFIVPVRGDEVVLRLKRSRLLPMVTSDSTGRDSVNRTSDANQNSAVYTDVSKGSAVIVKRINQLYSLEGSFIHSNQEWNLDPVTPHNGKMNVIEHRLYPMRAKNTTISFMNDTIIDTEDRPEQINVVEGQTNIGKHSQKSENSTKGTYSRLKRAITHHVIEIAFIVDYADYSKWEKRLGEERALPAMRLWYTFVAESINIRYQTIEDSEFSVSTTATILKILNRARDANFISTLTNSKGQLHGSDGAIAFRKWYPTQTDIPLSDHYMLITGFDIIGSSGIAVSGRTCTGYGVSICENSFTGSTGGVAAHELGHSLSAIHDLDTKGPIACTDRDQYIMATAFITPVSPRNEGNPWRFSPCSINAIKNFLRESACTLPEHTSGTTELPATGEGERAGQILNRDDQCILTFLNSQSAFCEAVQLQNGGLERLCGGMYCSIPRDLQGFCQTIVPQEYTSCGLNKWCVTGQCVGMNQTSSSTSTAPTTTNSSSQIFDKTTSTQSRSSSSSVTTTTTLLPTTTSTVLSSSTSPAAAKTTTTTTTTTTTATTTTSKSYKTNSVWSTTFEPDSTTTYLESSTIPDMNNATLDYPSLNMCTYLIYLGKGTEWWICVQRELDAYERRLENASRRDIPGTQGISSRPNILDLQNRRRRLRNLRWARSRSLWRNW